VRVIPWVFVLCTVLGAIGAFLPAVELRIAGQAVSKRTRLSLYAASTDRDLVRRFLAAYHGSHARKASGDLVRAVSPKVHGRARAALDDIRDAMDTLDDTSDADVRTAGIVFTATLWTLLGLDALMVLLVFTDLIRGSVRAGRLRLALAMSVLVAAIAVTLHLACRAAVWEANDEVGHAVLTLAVGAYLIPLAALAQLTAAIILAIRQSRRTQDGALRVARLAR
jgi:hypothetical protein